MILWLIWISKKKGEREQEKYKKSPKNRGGIDGLVLVFNLQNVNV